MNAALYWKRAPLTDRQTVTSAVLLLHGMPARVIQARMCPDQMLVNTTKQ